MPNTAATALWPRIAHQTVAISRPRAVAARMIARGAPSTPAGTTPTSPRPRATEPAMKLARPSIDGSPARGPTRDGVGAGAGSGGAVAGAPVASTVLIGSLLD